MVALQALSKYGAATYTLKEKAATVTVKSETFSEEFRVDEMTSTAAGGGFARDPEGSTAQLSGSGCVYVQVRLASIPSITNGEIKSQEVDP